MRFRIEISPAAPLCWAAAVMLEPNIWLACIAGALALHEAGHLCAIAALGPGIRLVRVRAAGLEIFRAPGLRSYAADAAVSLAGPLCSLAAGALALPLGGALRFFGCASLLLGTLNILPVRGLDGGEALTALLSARLAPETVRRVSRVLSFVFLGVIWVFAVWILLITGGNFSLFLLSAALFAPLAFG